MTSIPSVILMKAEIRTCPYLITMIFKKIDTMFTNKIEYNLVNLNNNLLKIVN